MELFFQDFSSWVQGMLFILICYHAISYFFTKDKSFLLYAIYLILVGTYLIAKTENTFSNFIHSRFRAFFYYSNWTLQIAYWMIYAYFSIYFLDIQQKNKKLAKQMKNFIVLTTIISVIFYITDVFVFGYRYMTHFFIFFFTPVSLIIVSFFLKVIFNFKDKINKFFVVGLVFFLGFSILSLLFSIYKVVLFGYIRQIDWFVFGVLLEAITISIGLGYKYDLYRKERDNYNNLLIEELKKNHNLKDKLNKQLAKEIKAIQLAEIEAKYESQLNELKLTSLLSQMNPHFIFNALNSIKLYIINNESKNAAHYLNKFSKLIRKILEASNSKEVSLQEELETMDLYMTIENIRFSNEINFTVSVDKNLHLDSIKLPPLVLQPFLENAIWHGLSSKKGEKNIELNIRKNNSDFIEIEIIDNGIGRVASAKIKAEKSIKRKSLGIAITRERLSNFVKHLTNTYNIQYEDVISDNSKTVTGTKVILQVPIL